MKNIKIVIIISVLLLVLLLTYLVFDNYLKYIFLNNFITITADELDFIKWIFLSLYLLVFSFFNQTANNFRGSVSASWWKHTRSQKKVGLSHSWIVLISAGRFEMLSRCTYGLLDRALLFSFYCLYFSWD